MQTIFCYNWTVRKQWYEWCENLPEEELYRQRTGGAGNILQTLFLIVEMEWRWIRLIQGKSYFRRSFSRYNSLEKIRELDSRCRLEVAAFVEGWEDSMENRLLQIDPALKGNADVNTWGQVMRYIIAHQIGHVSQLSAWAEDVNVHTASSYQTSKELRTVDL
ncbi:DinB family protein [Planococcus salinus]|uniref:Damage-inducible protein DinB n=1 Tax=Planococcus salinus TaxID=1848460 RepID=A0A3M8P761_9BACL|nr:DinB family protein [Planococcus salinus]RNF39034.1 damage-inducible protein DinB [Planococcus salinus]